MRSMLPLPTTLAVLLTGCAHTATVSNHLGVRIGDTIQSERDLVVYECEKWESTAAIWASGPKKTRCIMASTHVRPYHNVLTHLPAPNALKVVRIKELGLVDSFEVLLYVETGTERQTFILTDLDYPGVAK